MAGLLVKIEDFDAFQAMRGVPAKDIHPDLISAVKSLDEREELEPHIQAILCDSNQTPHGPMEIADILTHKVMVNGTGGIAAFILKGKSFPTVRAKDVAHQIFKLERIAGLKFAVLAASGNILDEVKEQFLAYAERLEWTYAFADANDLARLLIAYGYLCPRDARKIAAGRCPQCGYSPEVRILNLLQRESLKALIDTRAIGRRSGLVVLPTGSGKTRIAAEDAKASNASAVLYIAHTHEILDVAQSEFEAVFGRKSVRRVDQAEDIKGNQRITLISVQLLQRHISGLDESHFDYVIVDEFHHSAAKSYRRIIAAMQPKFLLGLTATPFRGDAQDIVALCDNNVVVDYDLRSGIDSGILCPYHYYGCFDNIDYSNISHNGARYDVRDLERALVVPERQRAVIAKWRQHCDGRPTLAFCCTARHATRVAAAFEEAGTPAMVYLGTTLWDERQRLLTSLLNGKIRVLCVVDVLNEGADVPFVDCLLFLRPTESQRVFYQQLGRGLRRYVGKSHCTIIDFIGNFQNAYKVVDYQQLKPPDEVQHVDARHARTPKDLLSLPLGCRVHFDERVVDVLI